jgi:hypothetical protein
MANYCRAVTKSLRGTGQDIRQKRLSHCVDDTGDKLLINDTAAITTCPGFSLVAGVVYAGDKDITGVNAVELLINIQI